MSLDELPGSDRFEVLTSVVASIGLGRGATVGGEVRGDTVKAVQLQRAVQGFVA
ncbi:hypothetical protein D3C71_1997720 [compost metagenome]